jgi:DNA-directed RNA polymerase specialized sigma subunit
MHRVTCCYMDEEGNPDVEHAYRGVLQGHARLVQEAREQLVERRRLLHREMCLAYRDGASVIAIAEAAGVSRMSVYRLIERVEATAAERKRAAGKRSS